MTKQDYRYNKESDEFLDRPFAIDMLSPVFGDKSVDTLFEGWQGEELTGWYRFINDDGDMLEFYPEGTYVIRKSSEAKEAYQLRTPKTITQFIGDMDTFGIPMK